MDGQTDGRLGKNNMSPDPEGGRHNDQNSIDFGIDLHMLSWLLVDLILEVSNLILASIYVRTLCMCASLVLMRLHIFAGLSKHPM